MISADDLHRLCSNGAVRMTIHVKRQCKERGISMEQIEQTLLHGKIIKHYPDDKPYPSCLLLFCGKHPLHVVASVSKTEAYVITAYSPDPAIWEPDFTSKKGAK